MVIPLVLLTVPGNQLNCVGVAVVWRTSARKYAAQLPSLLPVSPAPALTASSVSVSDAAWLSLMMSVIV